MRAYLINPHDKTITEVDYDGNWRSIGKLTECSIFTTVYIGNSSRDCIFLDDEGLFVKDQAYFYYRDYPQPLAGRGLVLGSTEDGDSREPSITLETLKERVKFPDNKITFVDITTEVSTDQQTSLGGGFTVISHVPHFNIE